MAKQSKGQQKSKAKSAAANQEPVESLSIEETLRLLQEAGSIAGNKHPESDSGSGGIVIVGCQMPPRRNKKWS